MLPHLRKVIVNYEGNTAIEVTVAHYAVPSVGGRGLLLYTLVSDIVDEMGVV